MKSVKEFLKGIEFLKEKVIRTPIVDVAANYIKSMGIDGLNLKSYDVLVINANGSKNRCCLDQVGNGELVMTFIGPKRHVYHSYEYIQIGNRFYEIEYFNDHYWRANKGQVKMTGMGEGRKYPGISLPAFSIDYLLPNNNFIFAVDFDFYPNLKRAKIDLSQKEIKNLLQDYIRKTNFKIGDFY